MAHRLSVTGATHCTPIGRGPVVRMMPLGRRARCRGADDRVGELLDKRDLDGYAVWRRILWAVEELQGTVPKSGEVVH